MKLFNILISGVNFKSRYEYLHIRFDPKSEVWIFLHRFFTGAASGCAGLENDQCEYHKSMICPGKLRRCIDLDLTSRGTLSNRAEIIRTVILMKMLHLEYGMGCGTWKRPDSLG